MPFFWLKFGNSQRQPYCIDCSNTGLLGHLHEKHVSALHDWVDEWAKRVDSDLVHLDELGGEGEDDESGGDQASDGTDSAEKQDLVELKQLRMEQRDALGAARALLHDVDGVCLAKETGEVVLEGAPASRRAIEALRPKDTYVLTGLKRAAPGESDHVERVALLFAVPPDNGPTIQSVMSAARARKAAQKAIPGGHRRVVSEQVPLSYLDGDADTGEGGGDGVPPPGHHRSRTMG